MITKKTLFILGAGASIPYGLPSGAELRNTLCNLVSSGESARLLLDCGLTSRGAIKIFAEAFRQSKQQSIDTFLANRPDCAEVGKLCIAAELFQREDPEQLVRAPNDDDWFQMLWKEMQDGVTEAAGIAANAVRFVTFNYDRSLEALLHGATRHSFVGTSDEHAFNSWSSIPITHVYGSIGNFRCLLSNDGRPYTNEVRDTDIQYMILRNAGASIKVIPEARLDDAVFKTVEEHVRWAEQICILGFSFDPLNMERLGLTRIFNSLHSSNLPVPRVYASTFGKTHSEIQRIHHKYFPVPHVVFVPINHKNQMTLRESELFE